MFDAIRCCFVVRVGGVPLRGWVVAPAFGWWGSFVLVECFAVHVFGSVSEFDVDGAGSAVVGVVAGVVGAFWAGGDLVACCGWPVVAGVEDGGWGFAGGVLGFGDGCDGECCE